MSTKCLTGRDLRFCKNFYECGGDLQAIALFFDVPEKVIATIAFKLNWVRPLTKPKPSLVSTTTYRRKLAHYLSEKHGLSKVKIGLLFGVSEARICNISREDSWKLSEKALGQIKIKSIRNNPKLVQQIVSLYNSGEELLEIATSLGFKTRKSISDLVKQQGVKLRPRGEHTYAFTDEAVTHIVASYKNWLDIKWLAALYEVDSSVIVRILRDNGIIVIRWREQWEKTKALYQTRTTDIRSLTTAVYNLYKDVINPEDLPRSNDMFHLDHIYSVWSTQYNPNNLKFPINIWEVCHPANLRLVCSEENRKKNRRSDFTADQLREEIKAWNEERGDPFFIQDHHTFKLMRELYGTYDNFGSFNKPYAKLRNSSKRRYYKTSNRSQWKTGIRQEDRARFLNKVS